MALIERETAIKTLEEHGVATAFGTHLLEHMPAIDAVPVVHGRVLDNGNPICGPCSECGKDVNRKWHFCPSCGARMDGGEDDG